MTEVTMSTRIHEETKEKTRFFAIKTEDGTYFDKDHRLWTYDLNDATLWRKEKLAMGKCKDILNGVAYNLRNTEKKYEKLYVVEVQIIEKGEFLK